MISDHPLWVIAFFYTFYFAKLPDSNSSEAIGWVLLLLVALGSALLVFFKISDRVRGSKPDASDLQTFATKKELQEVKLDMKTLSGRVDTVEADSNFQNFATQRALGRIEGQLNTLNNNKE